MGEGKPNSEAQANVSQETINDPAKWNTGTPKNAGDAATEGQYTGVSDANAGAGAETSQAQQVSMTTDPRPVSQGGNGNPSTYGSMKDGLPASGAATDPDKKVGGEKS